MSRNTRIGRHGVLVLMALVVVLGCKTASENTQRPLNSEMTQGNVQMHLVKGATSKAQVLEVFGGPNITTRDANGWEIWTYERSAREAKSNSAFFNVFIAGSSSSGFEESSRNMILIIKFDDQDIVYDFSSRYASF